MTKVLLGSIIITDLVREGNMIKKERTSITIDKEVLRKTREKAKADNRSLSNLTEVLYKEHLDTETKAKDK